MISPERHGFYHQRLRQPPILGYLLAGVPVGPFTPGPVAATGEIGVLAEIGVAFLMFALGVEFSFEELRDLGRVVALGGPLQILGTMLLGPILAVPLGLSLSRSASRCVRDSSSVASWRCPAPSLRSRC